MKAYVTKTLAISTLLAAGTVETLCQVTYTATWSGSGIAASGTLEFGPGVADFSGPGKPTWLQNFSISIAIDDLPGTPYDTDLDGLSNFVWSNSGDPITQSTISALMFSGGDSIPNQFSMSFDPSAPKSITIDPGAAGGTTYTMSLTSFSAVPEPEEWAAIASSGLLAFALWHRRSRKAVKA